MAKKSEPNPELQKLFKQAAEIASVVPESMQEAAFHRALDELMADSGSPPPKGKTPKRSTKTRVDEEVDNQEKDEIDLEKEIDRTKYPQIQSGLSVLDRSLLVLVAAKEAGVDGLTPSEISSLLTEKFRISTTYNAISMALSKAGNLVDRYKKGQGFVYRIMQPGEQHLNNPLEVTSSKQTNSGKKKATKTRNKKNTTTKPKSSRGRPGPKAILELLINDKYFSSGKTITEIREYLETNKGYIYSSEDIGTPLRRLIRSGTLSRNKNDNNQYVYSQPNN